MWRAAVAISIVGCSFEGRFASRYDAPRDTQTDAPLDAAGPQPPALVQSTTATANDSNQPLTATLPALPASGDLLVMIGAAEHGGLTSVSGGGVATWTRATRALTNTNIEIWFGTTTGASGQVTITFSPYTLPMWMVVGDWSNIVPSNALDMAVSTSGTTSPASAGAITTSAPRELVIFGVGDQTPNTFGAPQGGTWSAMTQVTSNATLQAVWWQSVTTTGTFAPSATETHHQWDAALAAFRAR